MKAYALVAELLGILTIPKRDDHEIIVIDEHGGRHPLLGAGASVEWSDTEREIYLHVDS